MKTILKSAKTISFKIGILVGFVLIVTVVAFWLSPKFSNDSKEKNNILHFSDKITSPECLLPGGFYKESIAIELTCNQPYLQMYYTIDGSEPSLTSEKYTAPIIIANRTETRNHLSAIPTSPRWKPPIGNVFKGTILRAISVDANKNKSKELVKSFFVDEKGSNRFSFPVICITVNEKDLFGYKKGIYIMGKSYSDKDNYIKKHIPLNLPWWDYPANYLLRGYDAERPAHIEFYEPSGKLGFESNVGLRINGNATRGFAQKSLRICFREKYGQTAIDYPIFPSNEVKKFNYFILRNSGNDWDKTMFRDAFMQSLMKNAHLDIQDFRPSIVFINGEYWGIYNIRERLDENYLTNKYHINSDSISILEVAGNFVKGQNKVMETFSQLLDFMKKKDMSKQENYDYVNSRIDINSFNDFIIANVYFCNSDWPTNNVKFWRYNATSFNESDFPKDGKWRWMLFDTDLGFGYTGKNAYEMNLLINAREEGTIGIIFSALLKNKTFVKQFISAFQNHLNTTFNSEIAIKKINEFQHIYAPEMQEHINRWRVIGSYSNWEEYVQDLRNFAENRPIVQAKQLNDFFNLNGNDKVTVK